MTRDEWETLLDEAPGDAATRLVYADWLDEQELPVEAAFQRWLGRAGRYPSRCSDGWHWFAVAHVSRHAELPRELHDIMGVWKRFLCYTSRAEAERDLFVAWRTLRPAL
jgi:uncharacterized protein (TIGR02996 family)